MPADEPRRSRVLAIDDEAASRDLVCEFPTLWGFDTDGAATGSEGLTMFDQGVYDPVVTDLMMPGLTGWERLLGPRGRRGEGRPPIRYANDRPSIRDNEDVGRTHT